jgi:protein TonB
MKSKTQYHFSNLLSVILHAVVIIAFMFIHFIPEITEDEFVSVGFGTFTQANSSGAKISEVKPVQETEIIKEAKKQEKMEDDPETKKVDLPKVKNDDAAVLEKNNKADDKKNIDTDLDNQNEENNTPVSAAESDKDGKGDVGNDEGNAGFEIAWGGSGMRKIYSYELPAYPEGVSKQIDIKLQFSILPDGTVGKIIPLMKADTRLEMAAINSLRNWRFEPLREGQKKSEQSVVIIFPYRLQ